jgi:hypothetical protein
MCDEVALGSPATLTTVAGDAFRSVRANRSGGISLVVGGREIDDSAWRKALWQLVSILRYHADGLVYASIMRGWDVRAALIGDSLSVDWPQRPDEQPRGIGGARLAFEDLYAPDAFGVQLLGPGYADRLPVSANWQAESVGKAAVLLQHVDPGAWFAEPFVPFRQELRMEDRPQRELLTQSRAELAAILFSRGILARSGFPDMEDS